MKKFRTVASVIIMVIAGIVGFFIGAFLNEPMAGTILFSMIAGIACIVYAIDNHEEQGKFQFGELRKSKFVMVDNMEWFNVFGLIFIAVIMIPNVVFAIKCKDGFDNKWNNKYVEVTEQVGRLGCFGFMIINIPGTWFGWWSDEAFALYLIVDTILVMLYCAIWIICFKKNSVFRALALSIIHSMLFLFSGIMSRSVLLIIASVLFAPSHIVISYKNVK